MKSDAFQVTYGFRYSEKKRIWDINVDHADCLKYLIRKHALDEAELEVLRELNDGQTADKALSSLPKRTAKQEALLK